MTNEIESSIEFQKYITEYHAIRKEIFVFTHEIVYSLLKTILPIIIDRQS